MTPASLFQGRDKGHTWTMVVIPLKAFLTESKEAE